MRFADHFFTVADLRLRGDETEWKGVAALAGVDRERLLMLRQVHGRSVAVAEGEGVFRWSQPEADAVVTHNTSVALAVRVADCAPILIADRRTGAVAAVHAGWRSTMQRIVDAAIGALQQHFATRPQDLVVAIGPSLGVCCGEMGEEVVERFREAGHDERAIECWFTRAPGKRPHFDLCQANRDQLEQAGVPPESIHLSGMCTRTNPDVFHSYRAVGADAGRMAGVIRAGQPRAGPFV